MARHCAAVIAGVPLLTTAADSACAVDEVEDGLRAVLRQLAFQFADRRGLVLARVIPDC